MSHWTERIYCVACEKKVNAILTNGAVIYPHRPDLEHLPFWRCKFCKNYVGCHHKTKNRTKPLGVIPTPEIRNLRMQIHSVIDPAWKRGSMTRSEVYGSLSNVLGYSYHTGEIDSAEKAKHILKIARELFQKAQRPI